MARKRSMIALIDPVGGHGGMDHYDYGLALGLSNNGVHVNYYTSEKTDKRAYERVNTIYTFGNVWTKRSPVSKLFGFLSGYIQSFRSAKRAECKVVHLQFFGFDSLSAIVVFIMNRFSFNTKVLTIHDISSFKSGDKTFFRNYILKSFDKLIVHNQFSFDELVKLAPRSTISIVPHGNYLHSVSSIPYNLGKTDELNLLFFGQVKKVKGLDILIEALSLALKQKAKLNLVIAGKVWHDDLDYYKNLIKSYKLENRVSCHFNYIPNSEVGSFFDRADVVVLPYRQIYQSGVLLLAMSYGRAVIASDLIPFKEIIKHNHNGLHFENGNSKDLAEKIITAARDKTKLSEFVEKSLLSLRNDYNWDVIGNKTLRIYNSSEND